VRTLVLISAGRHPVSGRPAPVAVEMQAIRLALELGAAPHGLHVGNDADQVRDALGHGLSRLLLLQAGDAAAGDPLPALRDHLTRSPPELVLTGRRGSGGLDSGMLPYRLAHALGWPIVHDVAKLSRQGAGLVAEQALPRGARRIRTTRLPCVVTVHPAAPPPLPFRLSALRGEVVCLSADPMPPTPPLPQLPYRMRPKVVDRVAGGGRVLREIPANDAADAIIAELQRLGLLATNAE